MKTLTPAERARRVAMFGITLPAPAAPAPNGSAKPGTAAGSAEKLATTLAMQRTIAARPTPAPAPPPPPPPESPSPAPASAVIGEPARKHRRRWPLITPAEYAVFRQVRALLQARYPQIFSWGRPLAIGIDKALREAFTKDELPTTDLGVFLRIWVRRYPYRDALQRGERRVNLDGSDAGPASGETPGSTAGAPNVSADD